MFVFRVTKYDPAHRDCHGVYTRLEWTSVSDVGREFAGVVLTETEYRRVEDAYVTIAIAFLHESGVQSLTISGFETHAAVSTPFTEGATLGLTDIGAVIWQILQEKFWCRLEGTQAFVHVGYDFYMSIGVPRACPDTAMLAGQLGLFVEPFRSPYQIGVERGSLTSRLL